MPDKKPLEEMLKELGEGNSSQTSKKTGTYPKGPEAPIRGYLVTREEHIEDIKRLNLSAEEKARRFADDMPLNLEHYDDY